MIHAHDQAPRRRSIGHSAERPIDLQLDAKVLDMSHPTGLNIAKPVAAVPTAEAREPNWQRWNTDHAEAIAHCNARIATPASIARACSLTATALSRRRPAKTRPELPVQWPLFDADADADAHPYVPACGHPPDVQDVQNDRLGPIATRVVKPLRAPNGFETAASGLKPTLLANGAPVVLGTAALAPLPTAMPKKPVARADDSRDDVVDALDALFGAH